MIVNTTITSTPASSLSSLPQSSYSSSTSYSSDNISSKLKVLMLHGFTQTGPFFKEKCRALERQLKDTLPDSGIDFYYPTGPCSLWNFLDPEYIPSATGNRNELHAWWKVLDGVSKYDELDSSLDYLTAYIHQHGPFDGVVGFSQGAVMAMLLTSLCESNSTPGRTQALRQQPVPITHAAPQAPFKFAIAFSGFKASEQLYAGLFEPRIATPSLHVLAELDTMVENRHSLDLAAVCVNAKVITHVAGHVVPTSSAVLRQVASFVQDCCSTPELSLSRDLSLLHKIWLQEQETLQRPSFNRGWSEADAKSRARPMISVRSLSSRSLSSETTSISSSSSDGGQKYTSPVSKQRPRRRVVRVYGGAI